MNVPEKRRELLDIVFVDRKHFAERQGLRIEWQATWRHGADIMAVT